MDKPHNAEEQAFWDAAALQCLAVAYKAAIDGDVDDYGPANATSDVANYADALLAERRKRHEAANAPP